MNGAVDEVKALPGYAENGEVNASGSSLMLVMTLQPMPIIPLCLV